MANSNHTEKTSIVNSLFPELTASEMNALENLVYGTIPLPSRARVTSVIHAKYAMEQISEVKKQESAELRLKYNDIQKRLGCADIPDVRDVFLFRQIGALRKIMESSCGDNTLSSHNKLTPQELVVLESFTLMATRYRVKPHLKISKATLQNFLLDIMGKYSYDYTNARPYILKQIYLSRLLHDVMANDKTFNIYSLFPELSSEEVHLLEQIIYGTVYLSSRTKVISLIHAKDAMEQMAEIKEQKYKELKPKYQKIRDRLRCSNIAELRDVFLYRQIGALREMMEKSGLENRLSDHSNLTLDEFVVLESLAIMTKLNRIALNLDIRESRLRKVLYGIREEYSCSNLLYVKQVYLSRLLHDIIRMMERGNFA
jgi:hypothetical protein